MDQRTDMKPTWARQVRSTPLDLNKLSGMSGTEVNISSFKMNSGNSMIAMLIGMNWIWGEERP